MERIGGGNLVRDGIVDLSHIASSLSSRGSSMAR